MKYIIKTILLISFIIIDANIYSCELVDYTTIETYSRNYYRNKDLKHSKRFIDTNSITNIKNIDSIKYSFYIDSVSVVFNKNNKVKLFIARLFDRRLYLNSALNTIFTNSSDEVCYYAVDSLCKLYDLTFDSQITESTDFTLLTKYFISTLKSNDDVIEFAKLILFLNQITNKNYNIYLPDKDNIGLSNNYKPTIENFGSIYKLTVFIKYNGKQSLKKAIFTIKDDMTFNFSLKEI
jgi:hypothetical protein